MARVKSCSIDSNSSIVSQVTGSDFVSNTASFGAAIYIHVNVSSVDFNSLITSQVTGCNFTSLAANQAGTAVFTYVNQCSLDYISSITSQVISCIFSYNTALYHGAGMFVQVRSCSVFSNSSIMLQVTGSNFISNTATSGAGICTWVGWCSLHSNSSLMLQITHSNFSSNTVEKAGAGFHIWLGYISLHSTSTFTLQITDSLFYSNKAERGAGVSVTHNSTDSCVSGQISIDFNSCRFRNNSASREGGSQWFNIFLLTKVHVKQSIFESNHAMPGSGLYRENIFVQSCGIDTCDLQTQTLIATLISHCCFIENRETAIFVKSRQSHGTLEVTNCSFKNNRCIKTSFAEDIFTDLDLELDDTSISKDNNYPKIIGINSKSDAKLTNVTLKTSGVNQQRQIIIAIFSHYITNPKGSSLRYQCPVCYQPMLSTAGLSDTGAIMVQITCDACFEGYYIGKTWLAISAKNDSDHHCNENEIVDQWGQVLGINRFCYTKLIGKCHDCPHGANCSAGVVALPNYWGCLTKADKLEFHRCPVGYCCNQAPCESINQCAAHREGTMCGRCMQGFTESLLSQECLPDERCGDIWVLPLFILWALCATWAIIFMRELEQCPHKILRILKQYLYKNGEEQENQPAQAQPDASDGHSTTQSSRQKATAEITPTVQEVIPNKATVTTKEDKVTSKEPIFWGLLTTERQQKADNSGHLKYLQIILYYIQDSALLQVDLALDYKGNVIRKIRKLLLNFSQLAVDLLDVGLKLCPIKGWTPVMKIVAKNMTGPLVFSIILMIYSIIRLACMCLPNKRHSIRRFWYPKLTGAVIFSILLFYQQIANTAFSLLYCIENDGQSILLIDGTVTCYQSWQIVVLIFAINWVIGIVPILMFLPGLLELRLIGVRDFFFACLMPGPMLVYWVYRIYKKRFCFHTAYRTQWQDEALALLQKTFVKTTYKSMFPFCWIGFMKIRRLALVLIFTFVSNLVGRVTLMCFVIVLFMIIHDLTLPFQDNVANAAYTSPFSLYRLILDHPPLNTV